jgi:hypothetical protein
MSMDINYLSLLPFALIRSQFASLSENLFPFLSPKAIFATPDTLSP